MNVRELEFEKTTSFRLTEDLLDEATRECRRVGIDRSALLRSLLDEWVRAQKRLARSNVIQIEKSAAA